jgi:hypothetical protein
MNNPTVSDFEIGDYGLIVHGRPTYEQWEQIGRKLWIEKQKIQWNIGDWVNFGESHYGETYAQALSETDYTYETLRNYAYVARKIPLERRRENISFSMHQELASLPEPEQETMMERIEQGYENRESIREHKRQRKAQETPRGSHANVTHCMTIDAPVVAMRLGDKAYAVLQLPTDYPLSLLSGYVAKVPKAPGMERAG